MSFLHRALTRVAAVQMQMEASLLFLDESYCQLTKIASVTGLRVSLEKVDATRFQFMKTILQRLGMAEEGVIHTHLPPLHGSDLLRNHPDVNDALRLKIFQDVADIVINQELPIYRVGYYISRVFRQTFHGTSGELAGYQLAWHGIANTLQAYLQRGFIIPVMDQSSSDLQLRLFSNLPSSCAMIRAQGGRDMLSISGTERILGEMLFADHRYSFLTQIVDLCGYLRHMCDRRRANAIESSFQESLVEIGANLEPMIAAEHILVMELNGTPSGPESVNHTLRNDVLLGIFESSKPFDDLPYSKACGGPPD